jgi:hypothetical protein
MENQLAKTNQEVAFNFFDPQQFETMQRLCKMFANSELVPDMYKVTKDNPIEKAMANCMIAIDMSTRIGASPLMIMQNMVIIYGRPSWSSKFLVATVNTCGRFNPLQYRITNLGKVGKIKYTDYVWSDQAKKKVPTVKEFDGSSIDNLECVAYTSAKGSDQVLESSPITIVLAIQEGWYTKSGSKWATMTRQMLMYRAASFWTSAYAPELSMGMKTTEEIEDIIDVDYEDMTAKTVEKEIKDNANKGETIGFEEKKAEDEKKTPAPNPEKPKSEPKESKDKNLVKLKELGYSEEDIKAMSPADEMRIIMGNVKKESKPGF